MTLDELSLQNTYKELKLGNTATTAGYSDFRLQNTYKELKPPKWTAA